MPKPINNVFDLINNIAFDSNPVDINIADSGLYSPYITNRYLTHINPQITLLVNNTVNKYGIAFSSLDHYKFVFNLIPKTKRKFIRYIKKKKIDKKSLSQLANQMELSEKEVELYLENFEINTNKYG